MNPDIWIILLAASLGGSLLYNAFQKVELRQARESFDRVLDNAARADERAADVAKIHQELLARPVQAIVPRESIEIMGNLIVQYLDAQNSSPIIYPKKDKLQ